MGSPLSGMVYTHKTIRKELESMQQASVELASAPAEETNRFSDRLAFLNAVVKGHQAGEEAVLWPALEQKFPHVTAAYTLDHAMERATFERISALVAEMLQASGERQVELGTSLRLEMSILQAALSHHIKKEDTHIVPLLTESFSVAEQGELAGRYMAFIPAELMPRLLPWIVAAITPEERADLVGTVARAMPPGPFQAAAGWIKGALAPSDWEDLAARVPQLKTA